MRATLPLLESTDFPPLRRARLETLQVNVGYRCNQSCLHCHVNAGPRRTEEMSRETADLVLEFLRTSRAATLDLTGGAPELHAPFRYLVDSARGLGVHVMDPLQPHRSRGAGSGGGGACRIPGPPPGRDSRLPAVLRGRQRRPPARQGGVRSQHRRAAPPQPARYGEPAPASSFNSCSIRSGPVLPPPQRGLEGGVPPESRRAARRFASTGFSCSPTCRSAASGACSSPAASSSPTWRSCVPPAGRTTSRP